MQLYFTTKGIHIMFRHYRFYSSCKHCIFRCQLLFKGNKIHIVSLPMQWQNDLSNQTPVSHFCNFQVIVRYKLNEPNYRFSVKQINSDPPPFLYLWDPPPLNLLQILSLDLGVLVNCVFIYCMSNGCKYCTRGGNIVRHHFVCFNIP